MDLKNLADVLRSYGRGVIFYADRWDNDGALVLTHLGDTEGDIVFNPNAEVAALTLPEVTGPAVHEADFNGENPTLEFPLYLADPALFSVLSPNAAKHGGLSARASVHEYTLAIFPESLFGAARGALTFAAGVWSLDGVALTAAQLAQLDTALWLWRGYFSKPARRFLGGSGDARRNIEQVTFQVMHHPEMPAGHALYTSGDPSAANINVDGGS